MINRRLVLMSGIGSTVMTTGLMGCASPTVMDYANDKPSLNLQTYFN
jgi:hypothetical protein